jgi:radical SAM superfamily enzyme YgiQ (UPF0313 family)
MSYKVLLLSPPIFDFYATAGRNEPLGLLYIQEALRGLEGVDVTLYDSRAAGRKKPVQWPESLDYLRKIYVEDTSPFALLHTYQRFGDAFDRIVSVIKAGGFDLLAIASLFSAYHPDVESLVGRIKSETGIPVVVGGWAVFAEPEWMARHGQADYYCSGDGETVLPQLIKALRAGQSPGRIGGLMVKAAPADGSAPSSSPVCPAPVYHQPDVSFCENFPRRQVTSRFRGTPMASMVISKGCRLGCAFCSVHRRYRFAVKPIELIRREMEHLHELGTRIVNFEDDNLFADRAFSLELLDLLTGFHQRGMAFAAMNGITALNLQPLVERVLQAGFFELNLSMVSGNGAVLKQVSRPAFVDAIADIAQKSVGRAEVLAFIIAGLPGATVDAVIADILTLARLPLTIGFSPLYLLPGVPLFAGFELPQDRRLLRGSALYAFGDGFRREDIASLWKYCRMLNHLKRASTPLSPHDQESLNYFGRSLKEGQWYCRHKDGSWQTAFRFSTPLPRRIAIADAQSRIDEWKF